MTFTYKDFHDLMLDAIGWKAKGKDLNPNQNKAVQYEGGPLWIIAGPGSGKSEVLVWRTLKSILVDDINPRSMIITTFTEKAGHNLQDRIAQYVDRLISHGAVSYDDINVADMRIGTLHSICNQLLREYRYEDAQNKKPMDEIEQSYFVYKNSDIASCDDEDFWAYFSSSNFVPNKWTRTKLGITILNRITEDLVQKDKLINSGDAILEQCAEFHDQYLDALNSNARYDFATIQSLFLKFLDSPQGELFLEGNLDKEQLPLRYVLVDEYQDTNPIQELIYFKLAGGNENPKLRKKRLGNITIVGDDDQSLYRFRGGTVDLLVNFDKACQRFLGIGAHREQLIENFRSHPLIVDWFNDYIKFHPSMKNTRAAGKISMVSSKTSPNGNWQPILVLAGSTHRETAQKVGELVKDLIDNKKVEDPSQIVLLFRSTREGPLSAGPYVNVIRNFGLEVYNPRSRKVQEFPEIQELIGCLIEIIDPTEPGSDPPVGYYQKKPFGRMMRDLKEFLLSCRENFWNLINSGSSPELKAYIADSINNIKAIPGGDWVNVLIQEILYKILNLDPFKERLKDPNWAPRYGIITNLLEGFAAVYNGNFQRSSTSPFIVKRPWIGTFYQIFGGLIVSTGLNDYEDPVIPIPKGYVQIMTYHQAKGLEFPYIFMGTLTDTSRPDSTHKLEEIFMPYRKFQYKLQDAPIRATQDDVRRYYMGMSRPKIGLILFAHNLQKCVNSFGYDSIKAKRNSRLFLKSKSINIF